MKNRAFTLIELIMVMLLLSGILVIISTGIVFFATQIKANVEKVDILSQISYFLEDAKLRCVSAIELGNYFTPMVGDDIKNELIFHGESNIYQVTPGDLTDNVWYKYYVRANKDLVLRNCGAISACNIAGDPEEVLVEGKYTPQVNFIYKNGASPAMLIIQVNAQSKLPILGGVAMNTRETGVRFWFINIAK